MLERKIKFRFNKLAIAAVFLLAIVLAFPSTDAWAYTLSERNSGTGYQVIIDDDADFFTDSEIESLSELMGEISEYCNVALATTYYHSYYSDGTAGYAEDKFHEYFGWNANGTIFVIDRDEDEIYIYSEGKALRTIPTSRAYSITDNTYIYATESHGRDYYTCSYKTFEQILTLMQGGRIAQPMKYICCAILSVIIALLINYIIVMAASKTKKAKQQEILSGTFHEVKLQNPRVTLINTTRVYSPQSSGGSGGGGHGGGGGGGHSGGGGGHSI